MWGETVSIVRPEKPLIHKQVGIELSVKEKWFDAESRRVNNDWPIPDTPGQVAERLNALVSKTSLPFGVTWVRIPPCPLD